MSVILSIEQIPFEFGCYRDDNDDKCRRYIVLPNQAVAVYMSSVMMSTTVRYHVVDNDDGGGNDEVISNLMMDRKANRNTLPVVILRKK